LVKSYARRAHGERRPNEGKQPETFVFERDINFVQVEVLF
jgi:hypothetical protein